MKTYKKYSEDFKEQALVKVYSKRSAQPPTLKLHPVI